MKLVFDTNIIVDVLGRRAPFAEMSKKAMAVAARKDIDGAMTANTATDIFYILRKHVEREFLKKSLIDLMNYLDFLDTTRALCLLALASPMGDFEDALLVESARQWSADFIVTRDADGFAGSPIKIITPEELVRRFAN